MQLPWQKKTPTEKRSSYDAQLIAALHAAALNEAADVAATSTVQAACGLLARSLSAATVTPQTAITRAVSPTYLYGVGESLVVRGEHVALIDVSDSAVQLLPAVTWDIADKSTAQREWLYKLTLPVPDGQTVQTVPGASVVHIRLPSVATPWQGTSAIAASRVSSELMASIEDAMRQEVSSATRARLISVAGFQDADPDDEDDPWTALINDIRTAKAKSVLMPAPATLIQGVGAASAPPTFGTVHLQPSVPEDLQTLRDRVSSGLYAAVGIMPATLFRSGSEATAVREAMRALHNLVLIPLGGLIETELSAALDTPVRLDFTRLQLGNLRERAQVTKALVDAGVDQAQALTLAGLSSLRVQIYVITLSFLRAISGTLLTWRSKCQCLALCDLINIDFKCS